jgi:PAS domain S-box-containing protein
VKERNPKKKRPSADGSASDLQRQCEEMEAQLDEAEETLRAIREGEVDAFAVTTATGHRIYTLEGSDRAYRLLIEDISEGALTLTGDGLILFCNRRFAEIVGKSIEKVIGSSIFTLLSSADKKTVRTLLADAPFSGARAEISLMPSSGGSVPVLLSATPLPETDPPGTCLVVTDLTERRKLASLELVAAGIAREIRHLLSEVNSALDEIGRGPKIQVSGRKKTAKNFYLKLKSASEKIEDVIRRLLSPANADTREIDHDRHSSPNQGGDSPHDSKIRQGRQ